MKIKKANEICGHIVRNIGTVFVGNELLLEKLLACALGNGNVLFEDYPGLGKTLLVKSFARLIGCEYKRIQFTPDLLPADIIGTKVWRQKEGDFALIKGPIFTNILLADEINRAPPKTQSALLEAMDERQISIEGETHYLASPFLVLSTQNPIELEGTYPLPEAQMDRFMLRLSTGYVESLIKENEILKRRIEWKKDDPTRDLKPVINQKTFLSLQKTVEEEIYIDDSIIEYINKIVRMTREHPKIEIGSSPRGGLSLLKFSRAFALINGRDYVIPDDVKIAVKDALTHRIILKIEYILEGENVEPVIDKIVNQIPVPVEFYPR